MIRRTSDASPTDSRETWAGRTPGSLDTGREWGGVWPRVPSDPDHLGVDPRTHTQGGGR